MDRNNHTIDHINISVPDFLEVHCKIPMGTHGRPNWVNGVETKFQLAHFGPTNTGRANGLSLNHVLSWEHIRDKLSVAFQTALISNPTQSFSIYWLVQDVFHVDPEAFVNIEPKQPLITSFTRTKHMGKMNYIIF